jgi:hypothetical protein
MATQDPIDAHTGLRYHEYYLYSEKAWEMAPSGVEAFTLARTPLQNAPVVVTPSGMEVTSPSDVWAKVSGPEKYEKVGYGYFDLLTDGSFDRSIKQFSVYPDSSGSLLFNGPLRENVYIEYEAGPSGFYIQTARDYNPIRNEVDSGFLHYSKITEPMWISLASSRTSIKADGQQGCKLTATVYDEDYDRVPNIHVVFEIQALVPQTLTVWSELGAIHPTSGTELEIDASGQCIQVLETANSRGEAYVNYVTAQGKSGQPLIKAYHQEASGVYGLVAFSQYYIASNPFTLDVSQLDTFDYLT